MSSFGYEDFFFRGRGGGEVIAKLVHITGSFLCILGYFLKETRSVTMNIFRKKKSFLLKSFVKIELSYLFTINMLSTAENCMEK